MKTIPAKLTEIEEVQLEPSVLLEASFLHSSIFGIGKYYACYQEKCKDQLSNKVMD